MDDKPRGKRDTSVTGPSWRPAGEDRTGIAWAGHRLPKLLVGLGFGRPWIAAACPLVAARHRLPDPFGAVPPHDVSTSTQAP